MNILFYLTRYPGIGGIENVTNLIAAKLLEKNQVSILSHVQQKDVDSLYGVSTYFMPDAKRWDAPSNLKFADSLFATHKFDAIIYQDSYASTEQIVCSLAERYNVSLFVFEHNSPLFIYNKRNLEPITSIKGLMRRILHPYLLHKDVKRKRYLLKHAKKYILLSDKFIPEFCRLVGVDKNDSRITYINNPAFLTGSSSVLEKDNIILCVSRLTREKCVDKMLKMWEIISTCLPDWRFIIVGDGPERSKLEHYVQANSVQRVKFIGFANPTKYYQKAKIFWMTSKYEGWGMTLIEAMQQGCVPVAYQTFSSISDIIDNGNNGFLILPNDMDSFIVKSVLLAKKENLRIEMSSSAIRKTDNFSIDKIINKWYKLLEYA